MVLFCRPGHKKWTPWRYAKFDPLVEMVDLLCDAIACNGKLYAYNHTMRQLCELVIAFGPHKPQFKRYGARLPPSSLLNKEQLVESCGELFIVRRMSIFDIDVFKMDFSQDRWEKVSNLGPDRSFVLIGHYSASFSAMERGIIGNTIYFTDNDTDDGSCLYSVSGKKNSLYSFSLAEKSISVRRNHPDSGILWILHDEMLSALRFHDKPRRYKQIINNWEKIDEDQTIQESTKCNKYDENKSESIWCQLPSDMQKLIVQHLPTVFDYMNVRAVCKNWRSLVLPIQWKPNHKDIPFKYPWLMFPQGEKGVYNFYDPISNLIHSISIPELEGCEICYSKQGWLLVTKAPRSIFFFEPFTRRKIQLPDLRYWFQGICFSAHPTSSYWQIFAIDHLKSSMRIQYLRSGNENWSLHRISSETLPHPSFTNPVFDGQHFCYLGRNGSLVFFQFIGFIWADLDWFVELESSPSNSLYGSSSRRFLVCYENELISLFLDQMGRSIHVFKLDRKEKEWVEIKSLEKETLYLSQTTSLCVEAIDQRMRNTIQFSMFSDNIDINDGSNISYSLKNQKHQIYKGAQEYSLLADLYDTKEFLHGHWIQPLVVPEMMMAV
ncbi:hypothetical protein REPUB_Repub17cG0157800 [Reevesia pubescens]